MKPPRADVVWDIQLSDAHILSALQFVDRASVPPGEAAAAGQNCVPQIHAARSPEPAFGAEMVPVFGGVNPCFSALSTQNGQLCVDMWIDMAPAVNGPLSSVMLLI